MLRRRLIRKILFGPLQKVSATLINIIAFDIAMTVYRRVRSKFTKAKPEKDEEEDILFIRPKFRNKKGDGL